MSHRVKPARLGIRSGPTQGHGSWQAVREHHKLAQDDGPGGMLDPRAHNKRAYKPP